MTQALRLVPDRLLKAEDFDGSAQPSAERPLVLHLAQLDWIKERAVVCFFGPPGTDKGHLAIALALKACEHGFHVAVATAQEWVSRLEAKSRVGLVSTRLRNWPIERQHRGVVGAEPPAPSNRNVPSGGQCLCAIALDPIASVALDRLGLNAGARPDRICCAQQLRGPRDVERKPPRGKGLERGGDAFRLRERLEQRQCFGQDDSRRLGT